MTDPILSAFVDGNQVSIWRRDAQGKLFERRERAEWVAYLRAADVDEALARQLRSSRFTREFKVEGSWARLGFKDDYVRSQMCRTRGENTSFFDSKGVKTYEADVGAVRRWFTDTGATIEKPRRCYVDFEIDSRVPFSRKEDARVLSWAVVDDGETALVRVLAEETNGAEGDLLGELWELMEGYDQVLAWSGDGFDFPVWWARTDLLNLGVETRRLHYLDHLALFERMNKMSAESGDEKQSMKLHSIATAILGHGKDDFDASRTYESWAAKDPRLPKYNLKDAVLLREIEEKTGFGDLFNTIAEVCRVLPDSRGLLPTQQMDGYMLRLGQERGVRFPTKFYKEGLKPEQYEGAHVMEPEFRGIARGVHVADFASIYPSIILTWNMSPETWRDASPAGPVPEGLCRCPLTGHHFDNGAEGILPTALRDLMSKRQVWVEKKAELPPGTEAWHAAGRKSAAYKVVGLAFYGVVGSMFSRYFDKRVAESITQNGVWLLKSTIAAAAERSLRVGYGDTDAIFVDNVSDTEFAAFVAWCNAELFPAMLREAGCVRNEVKLAYEKKFRSLVIVAAKSYVGFWEHYKGKQAEAGAKPEIKGLAYKRGDAALLTRRLQGEMIDLIGKGHLRAEPYREALDRALRHVLNDQLPVEEIVIVKGISKPLHEYGKGGGDDDEKGTEPAHVRVARALRERGEHVGEGTRVEYFVADGSVSPQVVLPIDQYGDVDVDRFYYWEKQVYKPTQALLEAAFPDVDWKTGYERVRPPKARGRKARVLEGQLGFEASTPAAGACVVDLLESEEGVFEDIKAAVVRYPGTKQLVLHVRLASGALAVLDSRLRVSGSQRMLAEIYGLRLAARAATEAWEASLL